VVFDVGRGFIAAVERDPGALAVVDGDRRQTYAEWFGSIRRAVGGLDAMGLRAGDHLLVALQNNWEMATLHWACQLAGVIVTPVNWRLTADDMNFFIDNAEAKGVVFQDASAEATAGAPLAQDLPRVAVGGAAGASAVFEDLLAAEPAEGQPRTGVEDYSVMLYTSGTTGRPKGVPRRHRAERAAAVAHIAQNHYSLGDCTLGAMPLYHVMGVRSLLAMAGVNGCFVCLPRFDVARALELIEAERITSVFLVPTLFHNMLAHDAFAETDISSVRNIGFAGASMTDGLLYRVAKAFEPDLFVNHYGSSEIYTFTITQDAAAKPGSAGKAGLNQEIRVVKIGSEDADQRCAPDEEGEIAARLDGDESFEGYWRRPDADAKALHGGWYFTGDIGYFDAEGDLFVTGRVDDMIITGGENVQPVEIESVLSLHPAVAEVAVAGLADERWGQRITAFIKRTEGGGGEEPDGDALDAYCRGSTLANFKRPREYVFVKEIPKSPVGKILRRQLVAGEYETE
jgi:2-furoate---CoA ligase